MVGLIYVLLHIQMFVLFMCWYVYKCWSFWKKIHFLLCCGFCREGMWALGPPWQKEWQNNGGKIQILIALESRMCYSNFMSLCTRCIWAVFYCGVMTLTTYICCAYSFKTYTFCVYFLTAYIFCAYFFDTYIRSQLGWPVAIRLPSVKSTPYYKYVCTCKFCIFVSQV